MAGGVRKSSTQSPLRRFLDPEPVCGADPRLTIERLPKGQCSCARPRGLTHAAKQGVHRTSMEIPLNALPFLLLGTILGGFAFILGLSQIFAPHRAFRNYLLALFWIGFGYYMFYTGLVGSKVIVRMPFLYFTHYPLLLLCPPALYLFLKSIGQNHVPGRRDIVHALPALLIFFVFLPVYFWDPAAKTALAAKPQKFFFLTGAAITAETLGTDFLKLLHGVPKISMLLYIVLLLRKFFFLPANRFIRREMIGLRVISGMIIAALLMSMLSQLFLRKLFLGLAMSLTLITVVAMFLFEHRFKTFRTLVLRLPGVKAPNDLSGWNENDPLSLRLRQLMEVERIYHDDTLTRDGLARRLGVPSHQLSSIINRKYSMNFKMFLNQFRLQEARGLLTGTPDRTILSIALEVGFGSKSSFNRVFAKYEGMTPEQYRERSRNSH